jgi:hypothetical protein
MFAEEILQKNREELEELRQLLEALDELQNKKPRIYAISITSNA